MTETSIFLKACRRQKTSVIPVWLMRQAGRYMKDYRDVREKTPFLDLCKNSDLACEVTITAQKKLEADAAIIFSDILLILEPMGLGLSYLKNEGPAIKNPVRTEQDIEALRDVDAASSLSFVMEALKKTRKSLQDDIALIGFAGAPFTLASYMIEGGGTKDFSQTRTFMKDRGRWNALMEKIVKVTVDYLNAQTAAGADALQLFDSWAGILSPTEYRESVLPYSKKVFAGISGQGPTIHFGTDTGKFLDLVREAGGDVIGVDHRINLSEAWKKIGYDRAVQGNLDPKILLSPWSEIKNEALKVLKQAESRPGYIFNLGHGVLPQTPEENVISLVKFVHDYR